MKDAGHAMVPILLAITIESLYKNPYICEDWHVAEGSIKYDWAISITPPALEVAEHYNISINITASENENTTYSRLQYHEYISNMLLANNDTDNNVSGGEGDGYKLIGGSRMHTITARNRVGQPLNYGIP